MAKGKNVKVIGVDELNLKLKALAKKSNAEDVIVGFSQRYAIHVHEDLQAHHRVGQAKYLETPARTMGSELYRIVVTVYKKTNSLQQALIIAGLRLQRAAQKLVPVDTGALKASAYTAKKSNAASKAAEAFAKSEARRNK